MEQTSVRTFKIALAAVFIAFTARLAHLQIIDHESSYDFVRKKTTSVIVKYPRRGAILDSNGRVLAKDKIYYEVIIKPGKKDSRDKLLEQLSEKYDVSQGRDGSYIVTGLKAGELTDFELQTSDQLPYVTKQRTQRYYPYKESAGTILGFCSLVSKSDLDDIVSRRLSRIDDGEFLGEKITVYDFAKAITGRCGLERAFNAELTGSFGISVIERDTSTGIDTSYDLLKTEDGRDIRLTLDIELQRRIEEIAGKYKKSIAVCVLKTTGEAVALVSSPSIDPNCFTPPPDNKRVVEYLNDTKYKPLINKCISAEYPPASVLKIIILAAAFSEGVLRPDEKLNCPGYYSKDVQALRCPVFQKTGHGHGEIDYKEALAVSCNVFFVQLGKRLGKESVIKWYKKFGLGSRTGIQLPFEKDGCAPGADTTDYGILENAIGLGKILCTPLQVAAFVNCIANGGIFVKPSLTQDRDAGVSIGIQPEIVGLVTEGMKCVVNKPYGTAFSAELSAARFAGKTGTADARGKRYHAWFSGFFPSDKPAYTITVFVEHGGSGGGTPVKICEQIVGMLQ